MTDAIDQPRLARKNPSAPRRAAPAPPEGLALAEDASGAALLTALLDGGASDADAIPAEEAPLASHARPRPMTPGARWEGSAEKGHHLIMEDEGSLAAVFGTGDDKLALALASHCVKVLAPREAGGAGGVEDERDFMLSVVNDLAPSDGVERLLAVQMAATHVALIRAGRRMADANLLPQFEAQATAYNKLARTFTAQVEALRKHRSGGRQTVVVQHVTVADGGQAIVGAVQAGGRGDR